MPMNNTPILKIIEIALPGKTYLINAYYPDYKIGINYRVYTDSCYNSCYYREEYRIKEILSNHSPYTTIPVQSSNPDLVELEEFRYENGYQYEGKDFHIIQLLKGIIKLDKICE